MNRKIKIAIIVAVFTVEFVFIGLAATSAHFEAARLASLHMTAFALKLIYFPKYLAAKIPACSLGEVWELSASALMPIAHERLVKQARVIASDKDLDQVETPRGTYWVPRTDYGVLIVMIHEASVDVYQTANRITPGSVVLDCGANVGVFTRTALDRGAKTVVAIEPASEPLNCLRRTFAEEIKQGRVIIYPKGVWDKDDRLALTSHDDLSSAGRSIAIDRGKNLEYIHLTTVDKLVAELKLDRVDFIKMDIEGAEPNALRGAAETIKRFRPKMAIALEHRPDDHKTIPPLVQSLSPASKLRMSPCTNIDDSIVPNVLYVD